MSASTSRRVIATLGAFGIAGCAGRERIETVNNQSSEQTSEQPNSGSFSEGWRCYRGDFDRRGQTSNSVSSEIPRIRATFEPTISSKSPSVSSPVLTSSMWAVDTQSFSEQWRRDLTQNICSRPFHSPVVADGELYLCSNSGASAAFG